VDDRNPLSQENGFLSILDKSYLCLGCHALRHRFHEHGQSGFVFQVFQHLSE